MRLFTAAGTPRSSYRVHGAVVAVTRKVVLVRTPRSLGTPSSSLLSVAHGISIRDLQIG
jgi:hypothetical protein